MPTTTTTRTIVVEQFSTSGTGKAAAVGTLACAIALAFVTARGFLFRRTLVTAREFLFRRTLIPRVLAAAIRTINKVSGAIPQYSGHYSATDLGLEQPAKAQILRDERGSPTIVAATAADTFALHGVAVGQDRLWQMHQQRMAACGRLAELKDVALKFDVFSRQLGFKRLGEGDWAALNEDPAHAEGVVLVTAFVRGVNWAARQRRAHGEMFLLTGSKWEPLTEAELCAIVRLVAFGMSSGWQHALLRQWMHDTFGAAAGAELSDTADGGGTPVGACTGSGGGGQCPPPRVGEAAARGPAPAVPPIPRTCDAAMSAAFAKLDPADLAWAHGPEEGETPRGGQGSNWMAVGAKGSATGGCLLAGDPHLKISPLPGFWYRVTYRGALNAGGLAMACLPGVVIGHNGDVAWSVTLGYVDCEDLYLERFNGDGTQYEHRGEWQSAETWTESFAVKGKPAPTVVQMRRTCHGPVLEDSLNRLDTIAADVTARQQATTTEPAAPSATTPPTTTSVSYTYALSYAGLPTRPRTLALLGIRKLLDARDYAQFDAALKYASSVISLNFSFASANGHIGYVLCGEVPLGRGAAGSNASGGDEWYPLCGWSGDHDYTGFVPHAQLPKAFDPPGNLLISANHALVDYDTFPHYLGQVYRTGYRAVRLHDLLGPAAADGAVSTKMLADAQCDVLSVAAAEFATLVAQADVSRGGLEEGVEARRHATEVLDALRQWDGHLSADSVTASMYQLMHAHLVRRLLRAGIAMAQSARIAGRTEAIAPALLAEDAVVGSSVLEATLHGVSADVRTPREDQTPRPPPPALHLARPLSPRTPPDAQRLTRGRTRSRIPFLSLSDITSSCHRGSSSR